MGSCDLQSQSFEWAEKLEKNYTGPSQFIISFLNIYTITFKIEHVK